MNTPEQIQMGIALLDREVPDWRTRINLDELHMGDCYKCILGQLFEEYNEGLDKLDLTDDEGDEYGFDKWNMDYTTYRELTEQWKQALSQERE